MICLLRYCLYDVEEPFLPQYRRNSEQLVYRLLQIVGGQ